MTIRTATAASVALAALAVPPTALGAAIAPDKPCYISTVQGVQPIVEPINLAGSGFTPGAPVNIAVDGQFVARVITDGAGNFSAGRVSPPSISSGEKGFTITAADAAGQRANATSRVTSFGVSASPKRARPRSKVTFRARGFTGSGVTKRRILYAHYIYKNKHIKTVRLGKVSSPCGTLTKKARQIPLKRPRIGTYNVQFDLAKSYKARRLPFVRLQISVFSTFRG